MRILSCHGKAKANFALLIWLNESVLKVKEITTYYVLTVKHRCLKFFMH